MSRNSESHFAQSPQIDVKRSIMNIPQNIKLSGNIGDLIPFYWQECLPGDTHTVKTAKIIRLTTLQCPPLDSLYADTYYFFVPHRLVWDHFKNFMGESDQAWTPTVEYEVPQITAPEDGWNCGSIADYMGIPTGVDNFSVNALPFRSYAKIVDDWFRDENLQDPIYYPTDDTTVTGTNGTNYINDLAKGGMPFIAAKFHDYYTSALPGPLKHEDILLPLGTSAPVYTGADNVAPKTKTTMHFATQDGTILENGQHNMYLFSNNGTNFVNGVTDASGSASGKGLYPSNLYTDLSLATASTVNQLRMAFQLQKFYERQAISGSRYIEVIKSMFGVTSPDARLQRSEYLGGNRVPVVITQCVNNSGTVNRGTSENPEWSYQGNLAAYSQTVDANHDFQHSFTEHGIIIGCLVLRYHNTYQNGLHKMWSRKTTQDYYWPLLQCIGEQPIKNKEIFLRGVTSGAHNDNDAFGYQEAWAEYRYKPNQICGELRSNYAESLDVWHWADDYESLPTLSADWIKTDKGNVDRSLTVSSSVSHQFIADINVVDKATRPMPLYSVPGYIDHF